MTGTGGPGGQQPFADDKKKTADTTDLFKMVRGSAVQVLL